MIYAYTARETATGRELRNTVEAASEQAAIAALLNRNLLVVEIKEKIAKRGQTKGGKVALADLVVFETAVLSALNFASSARATEVRLTAPTAARPNVHLLNFICSSDVFVVCF